MWSCHFKHEHPRNINMDAVFTQFHTCTAYSLTIKSLREQMSVHIFGLCRVLCVCSVCTLIKQFDERWTFRSESSDSSKHTFRARKNAAVHKSMTIKLSSRQRSDSSHIGEPGGHSVCCIGGCWITTKEYLFKEMNILYLRAECFHLLLFSGHMCAKFNTFNLKWSWNLLKGTKIRCSRWEETGCYEMWSYPTR